MRNIKDLECRTMQLLQSKFYRPIQVFRELMDESHTIGVYDFLEEVKHKDEPYEHLLNRLMPSIYIGHSEMVIQQEQLTDFLQCTDFHTVDYHAKKNRFFVREACYFHPAYELFILTNEDLANDYEEFRFESGVLRVMRVYYDSTNPNAPDNLKKFFDQYLQKYISKDAKISILLKKDNEFSFNHHKINPYPINLNTMYNEDFLPVHQKIKHDLTHNHKGVVLLHGVAGSGKTNYIKWLTSQIPEKDFIFVPNSMIHLLVDPMFMNLLIGKKNSVLVLEDCENYISERSIDHSQSDVVASILNIADGMLSDVLECQFVCTFNANLTEIDHALLRRGRLIAEYHFKELSVERCNAYLQSIGKEIVVEHPYSLAELTHIDEQEFKAEKEQKRRMGFF